MRCNIRIELDIVRPRYGIVNGRIEQWAKVSYAEAVADGIKFTCMEDPAFDYLLKIQIEVMR